MRINKITTGFVVQEFDIDKGKYVSQEFVAGNPVEYEDKSGNPVDSSLMQSEDGTEPYLPFDMQQPQQERTLHELLDAISVMAPGSWENDAGPNDWYAVCNDDDGIIAYFQDERAAYRFRLDYINGLLNPTKQDTTNLHMLGRSPLCK